MHVKKEPFKQKISKRFKMSGKSLMLMQKVTWNAAISNSLFTTFKKRIANYCLNIFRDKKVIKELKV
jgi:hypothetical protein